MSYFPPLPAAYTLLKHKEAAVLHQLPAVGGEQQVHGVVLQVTLVLQVSADQLSDRRGPFWPQETAPQLYTLMLHINEGVYLLCTPAQG